MKKHLCNTCKLQHKRCNPIHVKWDDSSESIHDIVVECSSYKKKLDATDVQSKAWGGGE